MTTPNTVRIRAANDQVRAALIEELDGSGKSLGEIAVMLLDGLYIDPRYPTVRMLAVHALLLASNVLTERDLDRIEHPEDPTR